MAARAITPARSHRFHGGGCSQSTFRRYERAVGRGRGVVSPWEHSQSDLAPAAVLVSDFPDFLSLFLAPSDLAESEVGVDVDDLRESVA